MYSYIVVLSVLAVVQCKDLHSGFGNPRQRLVFAEKYDLNPSIYTRSQQVVVNTAGNELISEIDVVDMREYKDGVATISSGGVGQSTVTIDLSGPTVFRGMTFLVKVYAVDANSHYEINQRISYNNNNNGYPSAYGTKSSNPYNQQQQEYDNLRYVKH